VIRAFIAIDLDPQVIANIRSAIRELKPLIPAIRWVPPENFHLTVQFLGDVEETELDAIGAALAGAVGPFPPLRINAKGLGVFPDLRRPRILWVGIIGNSLTALASRVGSALEPLGFVAEPRAFTPHLTIGRWRHYDRAPKTLSEELSRWRNREFGESLVGEVVLYRSVLAPAGANYQKLKIVSLDRAQSVT
jgi:RNA 2',3'-cyclic 3'-phosphodiesterase